MKKILLFLGILMAASGIARADAVTFEATVNSPRISLDDVIQLTLTFSGVNQDLDPINLPTVDGFSAKYLGPSTSVSIVNGDYHSERSFIYNLFPNKVGHFQIPAITATVAGQTYTTKPIDIDVVSGGASAQNQEAPSTDSLKDKVLIMVSVDHNDVYLNERIPVSIKLLVNTVPVRDIQYPQFDKTGWASDDFEKPVQSSQVVNGINYDTVEFKINVYPTQLGDLNLGPVTIQGNVLYKTGQNSPFGQVNDIFGANVFNNLFDSYATRPVTVSSQPIVLHVSALPQEDRPNDFSGGIGQFDFQASVSPLQVKAGDPLTLKMDITGAGNFKNLKMPVFSDPNFKTYEPQIKDTGSEKTAEEVIIPISAQITQVPALRLSYFDTSIKDYKTITQGPFDIKVLAPNPDQEFKAVGFADISHEPANLPSNQFSMANVFHKAFQFLKKLSASIWFWVSLGIVSAVWISYALWRRFQEKLENDPAFARRLKAVREARQGLKEAEQGIAKGTSKDFYALLSKVLRDYLANKWHQSSGGLDMGEIIDRLKTSKIDDAHINQLKTLLEQSDFVCFAGASVDVNKMRADLAQAQDLIAILEKSLK